MKTAFQHGFFLAAVLLFGFVAVPAMAQVGNPRRVPWTTSRITGSPEAPKRFVTEPVFKGLVFDQPLEVVAVPGTNRLAVVEVAGKIYTIENRPEAESHEKAAFADITHCDANFSRLYGLAFHPKFAENGICYISYVLKDKLPEGSRVSRFKVSGNPPQVDLKSEQVLIRWYSGGHNGAHLQFGPEGYLYITTGDAGDAFPPDGRNTGQTISDLEASILRIDVDQADAGRAYRIPDDNPFVKQAGARGEVWAYGLRNPWKMCFDPADGSLWTGDVGWEMWEMVYRIERGGNYGWSVVEGPQRVHLERLLGPTPILPPAVAHSHIESRSITGGYFSQTPRLPDLRGAYIYGDYVTGKIWGLRHEGPKITWLEELVDSPLQIVSFGLDQTGDVLIVDYPSGTFFRLAPNPRQTSNANFPKRLSETGLFEDTAVHRIAPGVIGYSINAEPWADGTVAERFIALPGESKLGTHKTTNAQVGYFTGDWQFPDGGVLAKTVSLEFEAGNKASRRRLETQVLHFDVDTWKAYNYIWNAEQTDAVLAEDVGMDQVVGSRESGVRSQGPGARGQGPGGQQTWHHASRTECKLCHTTRVGVVLGFKPSQLERQHDFNGTLADQLTTLEQGGLFAEPLAKREAWPNPHDEKAPLEQRARVYLHVNCGHCHTRGGGGSSFFDVQIRVQMARTGLIGSRPTQGTFGILGAEVVAAGDPYRSLLYYRMSKLGHGRMPQFGSQVVDTRGTRLMHEWIASITPTTDDATRSTTLRLRKEEQTAVESLKGLANDLRGAEKPLARLLSSPSAALQLADAIERGGQPQNVQRLAIERGVAHSEPAIRDLFERFIPEEQRVKRLGTTVRPEEILAIAGDASRGRELFLNIAGVQCKNCHKVGDQGQALGPDLTQIGKKLDKAKLLESIMEPSKTIDPQYVSYLVETKEGEVLTGLLVKRTDAEVVLKLADNKEVRLSAGQIERMAPQQKSLMPDLLLRDLTIQQVADLLEFLAGLR